MKQNEPALSESDERLHVKTKQGRTSFVELMSLVHKLPNMQFLESLLQKKYISPGKTPSIAQTDFPGIT